MESFVNVKDISTEKKQRGYQTLQELMEKNTKLNIEFHLNNLKGILELSINRSFLIKLIPNTILSNFISIEEIEDYTAIQNFETHLDEIDPTNLSKEFKKFLDNNPRLALYEYQLTPFS